MSKELRVTYQGSATIYAIIRKISDATVWNGSSFETWADGNIATYDVALTNQSGDFYSADFPSAISVGNYRVNYYVQAGGSPAITDLIVGTAADLYWDGSTTGSVSSVTLSTYALTTLEALKRFLRIADTDSDTLLTETINQTSALIERVTSRQFLARDYRERRDGEWQRRMVLANFPIQSVNRISYGAGNALHLSFTGSAIRANAAIYKPDSLDSGGGLRLTTIDSNGTRTATSLSFATYASVSALVTAIAAVTGWMATTDTNVPTADLNPTALGDCLNRTAYLTYPDLDDYDFTPRYDIGIIEFSRIGNYYWPDQPCRDEPKYFAGGYQNFLIEYNAGYTTVPADVALVCHEICAEKFYIGEDNPAIKSETTGPYSVTFGYSDEQMIRTRLANYIDGRAFIGG
jgi:hypothetical protein